MRGARLAATSIATAARRFQLPLVFVVVAVQASNSQLLPSTGLLS